MYECKTHKNTLVDALQWKGSNKKVIKDFTGLKHITKNKSFVLGDKNIIHIGDYVVRAEAGIFVMSEDVFKENFDSIIL
jgi:hypothetical protein